MRLGFCTMGYLDYTTVEEAIKRIAKIGYKVIDAWAYESKEYLDKVLSRV